MREMGRGVRKKEREGHRYTAIRRKSNEDKNRRREVERHQQEEKTEQRQKRGGRLAGRKVFTLENA